MKFALVVAAALAGSVVSNAGAADAAIVDVTFSGSFTSGTLSGTSVSGLLRYDDAMSPKFPPGGGVATYSGPLGSITVSGNTYQFDYASIYNDANFGSAPQDRVDIGSSLLEGMPAFRITTVQPSSYIDSPALPSVDKFSGRTFQLAENNVNFSLGSITFATVTSAVPEPATWAMMLVGFGMIGAASRYRRRNTIASFA